MPDRVNAKVQLVGFPAYDPVLVWPYFRHLEAVKPEQPPSPLAYLTVTASWTVPRSATRLFIRRGAS